jgi:hypothetical protein
MSLYLKIIFDAVERSGNGYKRRNRYFQRFIETKVLLEHVLANTQNNCCEALLQIVYTYRKSRNKNCL